VYNKFVSRIQNLHRRDSGNAISFFRGSARDKIGAKLLENTFFFVEKREREVAKT